MVMKVTASTHRAWASASPVDSYLSTTQLPGPTDSQSSPERLPGAKLPAPVLSFTSAQGENNHIKIKASCARNPGRGPLASIKPSLALAARKLKKVNWSNLTNIFCLLIPSICKHSFSYFESIIETFY